MVEKSVACWAQAGRRSAARSAMAEAAAQLQKGLDQLALLPDDRERKRRELELRRTLGAALMIAKGLAAPETGHAYARSRELWEQLGFPPEFLGVPFGQSTYHAIRGELDRALDLGEDLLRLSHLHNDSAGLLLGHLSSGRTLMFAGRFAPSQSNLEKALAVYDPIPHDALVQNLGFHAHIQANGYLGITVFCRGFPDQALVHTSTAIAEARRLAHPPSLAASLTLGAIVLSFGGDDAILGDWAEQLLAVASEQGFPHLAEQGTIYHGGVLVKSGDVAEGLSLVRRGSEAFSATGARMLVPYHMALLAMASEIAGQIDEAMEALNDALQMVERTGERRLVAELCRRKGQLLVRQGQAGAAEELYRKSLSVAEEQGGQAVETARRDEPCAALGRAAPTRPGPRSPRTCLWVVHRRLRHRRSERGEGATRRVGVSRSRTRPKVWRNDCFWADTFRPQGGRNRRSAASRGRHDRWAKMPQTGHLAGRHEPAAKPVLKGSAISALETCHSIDTNTARRMRRMK